MKEWGRESKIAEMYIQGEIQIFRKLYLRSTFGRLVQGHLKALNHLSLSSLLYFRETGFGSFSRLRIIFVSTRFSTLLSLIRAISKYRIIFDFTRFFTSTSLIQLRLFSTSQTRVVWRHASAQSDVMSSSSSTGLLRSLLVSPQAEIFPDLYNFPAALAILVRTPP